MNRTIPNTFSIFFKKKIFTIQWLAWKQKYAEIRLRWSWNFKGNPIFVIQINYFDAFELMLLHREACWAFILKWAWVLKKHPKITVNISGRNINNEVENKHGEQNILKCSLIDSAAPSNEKQQTAEMLFIS